MAEKSGGSGRITAGELFGQKRPPLYETIKNILRDYPSGQIFKVLYICTCTNLWKSVSRWVYTEKHTATTQNQPGWYELCIISVYTVCMCAVDGDWKGVTWEVTESDIWIEKSTTSVVIITPSSQNRLFIPSDSFSQSTHYDRYC
jgi:hypothetical protein